MQVDIIASGGIRVFPVANNNNENDIYKKNKNVNMSYTTATGLIISIAISNYSLMVVRQSFKKSLVSIQ